MRKVTKVQVEDAWEHDELFPVLQDAFRVLYKSYLKIEEPYKKPQNAKRWFLEDAITDDLVRDEFHFEKKFDYQLKTQDKNVENQSRIDIAINWRIGFGKYFKLEIECKQLKPKNINYILTGGINKFKLGTYSKKCRIGGMLLYNIKDDIAKNISSLNEKITKKISNEETVKGLKDYKLITFLLVK